MESLRHSNNRISAKPHLSKKEETIFWIETLVVMAGALTMVFPYFWMLSTALKTIKEANSNVLTFWSATPNWNVFYEVLSSDSISFIHSMGNTLIVEVLVIVVGTFTSTLAAFAFAKLKMKFRKTLLIILMSSMMVPYAALLLPQYRVYLQLGLANTLWPLIIPGFFGNIAMTFFLITSMQRGIPDALIESAKIDGCSYFRMYWQIALPLSKPAIAAQVIFWFVGIWNDYFAPSIYLTNRNVWTLQVALTSLNSSYGSGTNIPWIMAGSFLASIPMILIFIIFRKMFVQTVANSGVKE